MTYRAYSAAGPQVLAPAYPSDTVGRHLPTWVGAFWGGVGMTDFTGASLAAHPDLDLALAGCFDAVAAPDLWPQVIERLASALGAQGAWFQGQAATVEQRARAPISALYRDVLTEYVPKGWLPQDLRATRGWALAEKGWRIVTEADVSTPQERARLPIYNDLFRRYDVEDWAGVSLFPGGQKWGFTIVRSARSAGADDARSRDHARLPAIRPYLTRMLTFSEAIANAASAGALGALEQSDTAALVLDWQGRVREVNAQARALLGRGLSLRGGRLCADRADVHAALESRIAAALSLTGSRLGVGAGPLPAPTTSGGVLLLDVTPLRGLAADTFGRVGALVILVDPLRRPRPSPAILRLLYGLTPREADVAARIAAGEGVEEIAAQLGLRTSSLRQVIKALLWKTGARRQSELAALVAGLPAQSGGT